MIRVFFSRPSTRSIAAAVVGGVAMWLSRASFDVAGTFERPTRVAMLPGLSELAGLIVLALLLAAGLASLLRDIESGRFWSVGAADALTPLFALSLIALPFLPWIADWMPALRLLAGPGRMLLWIVVVGQVVWIVVRGHVLSGPAKAGHYVLFSLDTHETIAISARRMSACHGPT